MSDKRQSTLDDLKQTIVEAAAEAVLAQMTPQMMRRVAEEVLEKVLSSITENEYSGLGRQVKDKAEECMREYIKQEQPQRLIEAAVARGVNEAAQKLDAEVRNKVVEIALNGVHKALTTKPSRY